jgi:hypothetical protein
MQIMSLENTLVKIHRIKINKTTEDYEVDEFFDEILEGLPDLDLLTQLQKKQLIKALLGFLEAQNPDMNENFSFIHLIEHLDKPRYKIYYPELIKFNSENATITSVLLLQRYINSLKGGEWKKCVELMKAISQNTDYTENVRKSALGFYKFQMGNK